MRGQERNGEEVSQKATTEEEEKNNVISPCRGIPPCFCHESAGKTNLLKQVIESKIHFKNRLVASFVMESNDKRSRRGRGDIEVNVGATEGKMDKEEKGFIKAKVRLMLVGTR